LIKKYTFNDKEEHSLLDDSEYLQQFHQMFVVVLEIYHFEIDVGNTLDDIQDLIRSQWKIGLK